MKRQHWLLLEATAGWNSVSTLHSVRIKERHYVNWSLKRKRFFKKDDLFHGAVTSDWSCFEFCLSDVAWRARAWGHMAPRECPRFMCLMTGELWIVSRCLKNWGATLLNFTKWARPIAVGQSDQSRCIKTVGIYYGGRSNRHSCLVSFIPSDGDQTIKQRENKQRAPDFLRRLHRINQCLDPRKVVREHVLDSGAWSKAATLTAWAGCSRFGYYLRRSARDKWAPVMWCYTGALVLFPKRWLRGGRRRWLSGTRVWD